MRRVHTRLTVSTRLPVFNPSRFSSPLANSIHNRIPFNQFLIRTMTNFAPRSNTIFCFPNAGDWFVPLESDANESCMSKENVGRENTNKENNSRENVGRENISRETKGKQLKFLALDKFTLNLLPARSLAGIKSIYIYGSGDVTVGFKTSFPDVTHLFIGNWDGNFPVRRLRLSAFPNLSELYLATPSALYYDDSDGRDIMRRINIYLTTRWFDHAASCLVTLGSNVKKMDENQFVVALNSCRS